MATINFKKVLDDLYEGHPVKLTNEFKDKATITYNQHNALRFRVKVETTMGSYEPTIIDENDLSWFVRQF